MEIVSLFGDHFRSLKVQLVWGLELKKSEIGEEMIVLRMG